jgi:hypothetical protein
MCYNVQSRSSHKDISHVPLPHGMRHGPSVPCIHDRIHFDPQRSPGARPHLAVKQRVLESPGQLPSIPGSVSVAI